MNSENSLFDQDEVDPYDEIGDISYDSVEELLKPQHSQLCIGHEDIEKSILDRINDGDVPHSLILAGPKGIGKCTFAFRLMRYMIKNGVKNDDDAGPSLFGDALPTEDVVSLDISADDKVFQQIAAGAHPDMLYIGSEYDDEASGEKSMLKVEDARKVAPFMRMTVSGEGWRVVIIDNADTMNSQSQNAILKILEEPPKNTLLLLIVHRVGSLIPTIKSRCRIIRFSDLSFENYSKLVCSHQNIPDTDLSLLYSLTRGSVGRSIQMIEQGGLEAIHLVLGMFERFPDWDWVKIHKTGGMMGQKNQADAMKVFEEVFVWLVQELTKAKATNDTLQTVLNTEIFSKLVEYYSLNEWIEISTNIKAYFEKVDRSNLDKRQTLIGLFSLFKQ